MASLTVEELATATEIAYARARRDWLEVARRAKGDAGRREAR
jgi:hypothetical protein